jgi:hypothetical protein
MHPLVEILVLSRLTKTAQQNDVAGMVWRKAVLAFPTLPSCGVDLGCVYVVNCVCRGFAKTIGQWFLLASAIS